MDYWKNKTFAEELSKKLDDPMNIGFYYTLASQHPHEFLSNILSWLKDYPNPKSKAKLFTFRLKMLLKEKESKSINKYNEIEANKEALKTIKKTLNFGMNRKNNI